jgi:hypothetical protein
LYFPKTGEGKTNPNLTIAGSADISEYPVFNVYWQSRLVPETAVCNLPFFPIRSNKSNIPQDWKSRVKGYLFLDGTFKHISNNKLKITVDPNFDEWINNKDTNKQIMFEPRKNITELFSRLAY